MKRLLPLCFIIFCTALVAQSKIEITGTVTDKNGIPIPIGDVLVYDRTGDELIAYTTLTKGTFLVAAPPGSYRITISCLGYEAYTNNLEAKASRNIVIVLKQKTTLLDEVEVVAAKNPISYSNGNYKVDVQNPVFASIPDVLDVLSKLPNLQVAPDRGSITVIGKGGPLLYLGNQRITFEEFVALPPGTIASIELVQNPSAKYEAEGRAVILVTRKISSESGGTLKLAETASFKRNFNNYLGLNGSYAKNKIVLQGNLAYNQLKPWESNGFVFEIPERNILVDYTVLIPENNRVQRIAGFGFLYNLNKTDYFSINTTLKRRTDVFQLGTDTLIDENASETTIVTSADNNNSKDYASISLNLNTKLDSTTTIFTGLQYSYFLQQLDTRINNNTDNTSFVLDQIRTQEYQLNSVAARLDLEKEYKNETEWETGFNWNKATANALSDTQLLQPDIEAFSDFDYTESVYAAYSSVSGKVGKKNNFDIGVRVEHNTVNAQMEGDATPVISRKNTNLFPRAGVTLVLDSLKTLSLNYAKSITRPDFSRTNSISVFINPFLEGAGNVNLRPSITNELSLNFQKKDQSFFLNFYQTKNPMNFTIGFAPSLDTAVLSQVNLEKEEGFSTGVVYPYTKGIWTSNNTLNIVLNRITDGSTAIGNTAPYLYLYTNHQFKIAKDTTLAFGGWAVTKRKEGIFERNGLVVLEASIATTLFKKWNCALRFNDITRAMNFKERYSVNGVSANGAYFADGREMALSINYRFGSTKEAAFKNKDVDESLDRID